MQAAHRYALRLVALFCLTIHLSHAQPTVAAGPAVDTVNVDLNSLIDAAARDKNRFAVNVPHGVSSASQGRWSKANALSTWTYSTRIATAISLSFHASRLELPPSAVLSVRSGATVAQYRAKDISRAGLWSRPLVGDTLALSITVKSEEASQVVLRIDSLQAGYRGLGGAIPDHPHYRKLIAATNDATTDCTQNYSCNANATNQYPAQATVAVVVGNQYQCTGTLLNNTAGDATPYVLTARHCENGKLGGGAPNAATTVTIYWDAVTACGSTLSSIYDGTSVNQAGATTVVEQQDAWLIKLDAFPVAVDAYYAGWDATGSVFTGGYSIHHALGNDKQYVSWYGQALLDPISAATLGVGYDSTFWGVVNQLGNVGAGASGGALFDPNNHVVGSATLAVLVNGDNTAGVCPATPLVAPSAASVTALYTTLAGVWTSTADPTSTTGSATLQSVLDPASTGAMVLDGLAPVPINFSTTASNPLIGTTVTISWNLAGAQTCTASGGAAGDGWTGTMPASGSLALTEYVGGTIQYLLVCTTSTGQRAYGGVSIFWDFFIPTLNLVGPPAPTFAGSPPFDFFWDSLLGPCTGSGGLPGDGWAGSQPTQGSQQIATDQVRTITYTLTCGARQGITTGQVVAYIVAPAVSLTADYTLLTVGSHVTINTTGGGSCVKTGGAGNTIDGWATYAGGTISGGSTALVTETVPGTYTYTITCTGGGLSASSSATVVFTNDTPAASLTPTTPQQVVYSQSFPPDPVMDLIWTANVSGCSLGATAPNGTNSIVFAPGDGATPGAAADVETVPGHYVYTLSCQGGVQATTAIDWVTSLPPPTLTASGNTWVANAPYTLSWQSAAGSCTASGGAAGDGWAGAKSASGSQTLSESTQGAYTFVLSCGSGATQTQSQVVALVPPPQVYVQGGGAINSNSATTLWRATLAPCTYLDTSTGPGATPVAVPPVGSVTSTPQVSGTYAFSVTCGTGAQAITTWTQSTITLVPPTTLTVSANSVPVDTSVTLTWSSSGQYLCYAGGGSGSDYWSGTHSSSGSMLVTSAVAGTVIYNISCDQGTPQRVQVTYTAVAASSPVTPTPNVTLTPSSTTIVAGGSVTLTWQSQNANACSATGGTSGDGWTGTLALSGSKSITEMSAGQVTYGITCTGAPPAATAQAVVTYSASSSGTGSSSGSSGHGGGGAFDARWLLLLAIALATRLLQGSAPHAPLGTSHR
jgi:hypothetical protein